MENSTNALLMAAEILIAVLVLSFLSFLIITFGSFSKNMNAKMTESQIAEFNNQFLPFSNRTNITAQEIASIINFAKQANDRNELKRNDKSEYYVRIYIDSREFFNDYTNSEYLYEHGISDVIEEFIENNNEYYFSCNAKVVSKINNEINVTYNEDDIKFNDSTALVYEIHFHKVDPAIISALTDEKH